MLDIIHPTLTWWLITKECVITFTFKITGLYVQTANAHRLCFSYKYLLRSKWYSGYHWDDNFPHMYLTELDSLTCGPLYPGSYSVVIQLYIQPALQQTTRGRPERKCFRWPFIHNTIVTLKQTHFEVRALSELRLQWRATHTWAMWLFYPCLRVVLTALHTYTKEILISTLTSAKPFDTIQACTRSIL